MNPVLQQAKLSISEFWAARGARERAMLTASAAMIVLLLIHTLLLDPALSGRRQLEISLPALRQQAAQLQALAKEAATLSGKSVPAAPTITRESIEAALAHHGLKPQSVVLTGELAQVKLTSVSFAGTLGWLEEMQKTALLSVVEANIVALPRPDMVDAALTLRQLRHE